MRQFGKERAATVRAKKAASSDRPAGPDVASECIPRAELHDSRRTTRSGEPVHIGNDTQRMPGPENTYQSYGTAWANLSNSLLRLYKHWIHEGGISTPLIAHWPKGLAKKDNGGVRHAPGYLPDIIATIVDVTGATYPATATPSIRSKGSRCWRCSAKHTCGDDRKPMFWEHEGNAAVRIGKWKLVKRWPRAWELYDMDADRTELDDLASREPERVQAMAAQYDAWAARCGVLDREKVVALMKSQGVTRAFWEKDEV